MWRIWRLQPDRKAVLYFPEPLGARDKKMFLLRLSWFDVFHWDEPPLDVNILRLKGKWYTNWNKSDFWAERLKQRLREMKRVMEELIEESGK